MQLSPWFLGACVLACVSGGVAGASIASDPLQRNERQWMDTIPRHDIAYPDSEAARKLIAPRNQYDLQTQDGVIPVADLAFHGRLRDRYRDQPYYFGKQPLLDHGADLTSTSSTDLYVSDPTADYADAPRETSVPTTTHVRTAAKVAIFSESHAPVVPREPVGDAVYEIAAATAQAEPKITLASN